MLVNMMRFLQEQATISSINYETVSSSSPPTKEYTTQFTSPSMEDLGWLGKARCLLQTEGLLVLKHGQYIGCISQ